jgi:hypothetical protein
LEQDYNLHRLQIISSRKEIRLSQETWEILTNHNIDRLEMQMAMQCAPLIAGLKISNLLNIRREDFASMQEIVKRSQFSWYLLFETEEKMSLLLFQRDSLEYYLETRQVRDMLKQAGYENLSLGCVLKEFSIRYKGYMETKNDFPHEMGLLLGYPTEDVEGFITHQGEDCLCVGYWKVYANKERKLKIFERFEKAKERLIQLLSSGISMGDIIDMCCNLKETNAVLINY